MTAPGEPEKHADNRPPRDARGRWRPGASGNPAGRPRLAATLTTALRAELDAPATLADGTEGTKAQRLAEVVVGLALGGEKWACELAFDRLEGRPVMSVVGVEDEPILLRWPLAPPNTEGPIDDDSRA